MNDLPELLLHICCGPCATHPITILQDHYRVTGFFYNPNLYPVEEYDLRLNETRKYLETMDIPLISPDPDHGAWIRLTREFSQEPEGGHRCNICFQHRLERAARESAARKIPIFTTTLTVGPNKPGRVIFPIGHSVAQAFGVKFLEIDFKKKDGFKHSCQLSRDAGLYRQDYCGCEFSYRDRQRRLKTRESSDDH